ncbi:E3 ubiquitin-protein ligase UPL2 [Linum perenne]
MEWLFSHPEEVQEDDELARALAMSLGNSESDVKEDAENSSTQQLEEDTVQLPPVGDLIATCIKLLQVKESVAFPVRDLLSLICSQNDGHYRSNVITVILDQVNGRSLASDEKKSSNLFSLFHVLALILHEDVGAREVASSNGLVQVVLDLLSEWDAGCSVGQHVPKWVTTAFLVMDRLLQSDKKLNPEFIEQLKKDSASIQQTSLTIDEEKRDKLETALGSPLKHISIDEQKRLIQIACNCIKKKLPSEMMHAVLQLCSSLTRSHSSAISFLEAEGISSLLSLPTSSLFPGFDTVAASIICHVLEDPQTLQQAMESEIRHSLVAAANRHSNGRVTPRNFLTNLSSVISRDPVTFMQAARAVCQVEMVGERSYIVLLKDREKDKNKEKEKDKDKTLEKERAHSNERKHALGNNTTSAGSGHGKLSDTNSKGAKANRKSPQSFVHVIELLLDSIIGFVPPSKDEKPSLNDMDIDVAAVKGKGKAVATMSEANEVSSQEASASLAKIVFILKLLTEIVLMYSSSVHVLLRRDAEVSSSGGPHQKNSGLCSGGIFYHMVHKFIPCSRNVKKERKTDGDWRHKLATRASQFLVAACVRSAEARKRVFMEIGCILNKFVDSSEGLTTPSSDVQTYVDLLNDVLAGRTPTGSYISSEAAATFIEVGLVKSLTRTLEVLDLDHAESPKVVTGLIKALELVTKEHISTSDSTAAKGENAAKTPVEIQARGTENHGAGSQPAELEIPSNPPLSADRVELSNPAQNYGGSETVTDDMEHDQDLDGSFVPATEDDYMQESSGDTRGIGTGLDTVEIQFDIQPHGQEILEEDEDEDMSADEGDEVDEDNESEDDEDEDEDDEEHNDLEEDEVHHLPHPDTDQDDHDMDDDEFDEEVLEEDDEDEEQDDDGVLLRLEEGINGINVFDHIEVFGRDHSFPSETLHVMPVEVFGSRRQGRTTSIYNLLGRSGDSSAPSRHPLLSGNPQQLAISSQGGNFLL